MKTLNDAIETSKLLCLALSKADNEHFALTDINMSIEFYRGGMMYHGELGPLTASDTTLNLTLCKLLTQARDRLTASFEARV